MSRQILIKLYLDIPEFLCQKHCEPSLRQVTAAPSNNMAVKRNVFILHYDKIFVLLYCTSKYHLQAGRHTVEEAHVQNYAVLYTDTAAELSVTDHF